MPSKWLVLVMKGVVMIKVATVCTGIGSPEQALKNIGIKHEIVFGCEIDKYARQTYLANFTPNQMFDDMTKQSWERTDIFPREDRLFSDLFIGGIPCQAFSLAGKRLGELDPRGLLFFDFYRYVKHQKPKAFIIENVKGLLSDNNGKTFQNWLQLLGRSVNTQNMMFQHPDSLGYNLHWTVLNTKDFGLPQNRERVFLVGIRSDLPNTFRFPIGWVLDKRLKDVLEDNVDEKYYLSEKMLNGFVSHSLNHSLKGNGFKFEPINDTENEIASCVTARVFKMGVDDNYIQVKEATKQGYAIAEPGDSINLSNPNSETRRGRVGRQIANTLDTACNQAVVEPMVVAFGRSEEEKKRRSEHFKKTGKDSGSFKDKQLILKEQYYYDTLLANPNPKKEGLILENQNSRIRRLTPLECFRLQGFPDDFIKPVSDTQLYKQAGNTISVPVIQGIIENLIPVVS